MKPTKVILRDASYLHSKTSITFILKDVVIEDNKIYYFDTSATFEDQEVKFEFPLFDSDMDNLKHMDYDNPVTKCSEPNYILRLLILIKNCFVFILILILV